MRNWVSLLFSLLCLHVSGQNYRFTPYPYELYFGAGQVLYQGDLPSTSFLTSDKKMLDKPLRLNYAITVGVGKRLKKRWAFRNNVTYLNFSGDDKLDQNKAIRNLSFRTRMIEYSPLLEFSILHWDAEPWNRHHHVYLATGLSIFYFNPQAELNGKYYNLQPLGTEGQGLTGTRLPYSRLSAAIPFVSGYRYRLNKQYVLGVEMSLRKSFTDYLDDVSTNYYDNHAIEVNYGVEAAQLADRNLSGSLARHGGARGNPSKRDNYFYFLIQASYFLGSNR